MSKSAEPLRGEAAWRAAKKGVADRNDAAFARGRRERAARNSAWATKQVEEERQSNRSLPTQPEG